MPSAVGILRSLAPILCAVSLGSATAFGQAASNVRCNKCVDAGDIAKGAIVKRSIAKGAVVRSKIAAGAVDAARLAGGAVTEAAIGNGAVTEVKIRDGAVSADKIAPLAVTGDKIAPQAVTGAKLAPGAVAGANIADGAVTADALAGSITGPKFAAGAVTADKIAPGVGGLKLARTIVISATGTPTENGDALRLALFNITDNAADNRYVVKLEPGIYDIGPTSVFMKPFVDIEGSGEGTTFIRGGQGGSLVQTANNVALRALAVEHDHDAAFITIGIDVNGTNVRLSHVTAHAENDLGAAFGIRLNDPGVLSHVSASAFSAPSSAFGVQVIVDGVELLTVTGTGSTTTGTGVGLSTGVASGAGTTVRHSVFTGTPAITASASSTVSLSATQLIGGRSGTGTFRCVGAYDANFAALDGSCN